MAYCHIGYRRHYCLSMVVELSQIYFDYPIRIFFVFVLVITVNFPPQAYSSFRISLKAMTTIRIISKTKPII